MNTPDPNALYIRRLGRTAGPYDLRQLQTMIKRGTLSRFHEVSADGQQWISAAEYPGLFDPDTAQPAQQTNTAEATTAPEESPAAAGPDPESEWHYEANEQPVGPVTFETLQALVTTGAVPLTARVWTKGMDDWASAETLPALNSLGPS